MIDISIIIPTYNRAQLLPRAISSCLEQSLDDIEIIVVDDGSTDNTNNVVNSLSEKVNYVKLNRNGGAQQARNKGIDIAKGEYLKFFDSDDLLEPGAINRELQLAREQAADIVVSGWGVHSPQGRSTVFSAPEFRSIEYRVDDVLAGKGVFTSAAIYRTEYIRQHGLRWDSSIIKLDDWDWFSQAILRQGSIVHYDGVSYWQCAHAGSRLTDASMLVNAQDHHRVLGKIGATIESIGQLNGERKKALARYYFKELQVLARYSKADFEAGIARIYALHPEINPANAIPNRYLGWFASIAGLRFSYQTYALLRQILDKIGNITLK